MTTTTRVTTRIVPCADCVDARRACAHAFALTTTRVTRAGVTRYSHARVACPFPVRVTT